MSYKKSQAVKVRDCDGVEIPLKVWKDKGEIILVVSDNVFRLLSVGEKGVWPIGVPRSDVSPGGRNRGTK